MSEVTLYNCTAQNSISDRNFRKYISGNLLVFPTPMSILPPLPPVPDDPDNVGIDLVKVVKIIL